jgi:two-component SAPR family response regulator
MSIRTILVDDEKLAIQGLQLRLEKFPDVEIIDTCSNGREAIRKIKTEKPDLVFLDIQMPGFDGFSVVKGVMEIEPPLFVFVTAYQEHAVRAFEANAVNYLMKPVDEDKLATRSTASALAWSRSAAPRRPRSSRPCWPKWRPMRSIRSPRTSTAAPAGSKS